MINIQIQGCQIYPKDRSRGRDSFELQRTGHSHQGGEVMGTREPSSMISEFWPWSRPWPRAICLLVCLSTNSIVAEVYLIISCHYRESMIIFLVRQKYNTRLLIQQKIISNCCKVLFLYLRCGLLLKLKGRFRDLSGPSPLVKIYWKSEKYTTISVWKTKTIHNYRSRGTSKDESQCLSCDP